MASKSPLKLIFGAGNIGDKALDSIVRFDTSEEVKAVLDTFISGGYNEIDTARGYSPSAPGTSEPRLGAVDAGSRFSIDTKVFSREPGCHGADKIAKQIDLSLAALKLDQINVEYLHHPDRATPFEETCEALDKAYRAGKFKYFGLSNYTAAEVEQIVQICERRGFVKPSVYQGQYNAIVRGGEQDLFPILRKYSIAFYAYSPPAAGFFAGNHKKVRAGGRYDQANFLGKYYAERYLKRSIQDATDAALLVAAKHGINGHAAALRWTVYHSILDPKYGDAVIIGASSPEQLTANLDMIEQGPLPADTVTALEALYAEIICSDISYHD